MSTRDGTGKRRRRLLQHDYGLRQGQDREKINEGLERIFGKKPLPNERRGRYVVRRTQTTDGGEKIHWSDGSAEIIPCSESEKTRKRHHPLGPEVNDTYSG